MIKPKGYDTEKAKETAEMRLIQDSLPFLYRSQDWTKEQIEDWNSKATEYNLLAEKAGLSPGFWQVILDMNGKAKI